MPGRSPATTPLARGDRRVELTATERRLLEYLAAQRGRVVSKEQILLAVWGYEDYDPNLVEVHVSALRRKLGGPALLHTVRGLGYVLRLPALRRCPLGCLSSVCSLQEAGLATHHLARVGSHNDFLRGRVWFVAVYDRQYFIRGD